MQEATENKNNDQEIVKRPVSGFTEMENYANT